MNVAHFDQQIDVDAPVATVWSILSDPAKWSLWFPGIQSTTSLSAVQNGTAFQWQHENHTDTGMVARVDANKELQVVTNHEGHQATHTFKLDHHGLLGGGKTKVDYALDYDVPGGIIGNFVVSGNPIDSTRMRHTVQKIKELAEGEAGRS